VFVLDDDLRPADAGELWVRGPTVMKGYWADAERTGAVLRQNPLHDRFPDPAYRTGDLVRRRADGRLDFVGRRDHQVKCRGHRVELGEVESALLADATVREAAVVAVPDPALGHALVAFVCADGGFDETALRRRASERIPPYMLPTTMLATPRLPRTTNGKVDRRALERRAATAPTGGRRRPAPRPRRP